MQDALNNNNRQPEMRSYNPTWREKSSATMQDVLMNFGIEPYKAGQFSRQVMGGNDNIGLADFTPVGMAFGVQEGDRTYQRGLNTNSPWTQAAGIGEMALNAIPGAFGAKAALKTPLARNAIRTMGNRYAAGKSPIPVGMSIEDVSGDTMSNALLGKGPSFLDDAANMPFDEAVGKRKQWFADETANRAAALAAAQDPASRVSGIKAPYTGKFGYGKTLPLSQIQNYDAGVNINPHLLADVTPRKQLNLSDLEGKLMTVAGGDKMHVGSIDRVKGQPIEPVETLGGVENASLGTFGNQSGWQSAGGKMKPLSKIVSENPEESVLVSPLEMGSAASDFQAPTVRVLDAISDPTAITKTNAKTVDTILGTQDKTGTYPGVKTDEFMPWLLSQSNTVRSGLLKSLTVTPKSVKDMVPKGMAPYELIPGFDIPAARHAVTTPNSLYKIQHPSDPSLGAINYFDSNAPLVKSSEIQVPHESFDYSLSGGRYGNMPTNYEIPFSLTQPDYIAARRAKGSVGNDFGPIAQVMINEGIQEPRQRMTAELLKRIENYQKAWDNAPNY
tara:strand:- start:253 stop:1926 length:1674 start_codon:yes stop_codon:yes gene_type:complete